MGAVITNDGFSDVYLYYAIGAAGFATDEFLLTCQVKLRVDLASYQTYFAAAPTTYTGGNDYFTAADFNSPHRRSIGSDGGDTVHASAAPVAQKWYRMAFQRLNTGGGNHEQRWWIWDLDGTNEVEVLRSDVDGLSFTATTRLCLGSVPYTTNEGCDATFRCWKAWTGPRTKAAALAETASGMIETADGLTNLWGQWPLISSGVDISGNGRDLTIELNGSAASWLVFDGEPDPATPGIRGASRIRRPNIFAPGLAR